VALLLALVAVRPVAAKAPAAAGTRATRSAVEARLRAYDTAKTLPDWHGMGAGVDEVLVEIGRDAKVEVLVRARAVSALGYFPTPLARRFLEQTVEGKAGAPDAGDRLLLRKAAVALGWMGGLGVPDRLAPLLGHGDPEVRVDAAIGLGLTRLPAAAAPLRKRFDVESEPRVRAQIGRQLRAIEDAQAAASR
jgi:HEAT repeat protein